VIKLYNKAQFAGNKAQLSTCFSAGYKAYTVLSDQSLQLAANTGNFMGLFTIDILTSFDDG